MPQDALANIQQAIREDIQQNGVLPSSTVDTLNQESISSEVVEKIVDSIKDWGRNTTVKVIYGRTVVIDLAAIAKEVSNNNSNNKGRAKAFIAAVKAQLEQYNEDKARAFIAEVKAQLEQYEAEEVSTNDSNNEDKARAFPAAVKAQLGQYEAEKVSTNDSNNEDKARACLAAVKAQLEQYEAEEVSTNDSNNEDKARAFIAAVKAQLEQYEEQRSFKKHQAILMYLLLYWNIQGASLRFVSVLQNRISSNDNKSDSPIINVKSESKSKSEPIEITFHLSRSSAEEHKEMIDVIEKCTLVQQNAGIKQNQELEIADICCIHQFFYGKAEQIEYNIAKILTAEHKDRGHALYSKLFNNDNVASQSGDKPLNETPKVSSLVQGWFRRKRNAQRDETRPVSQNHSKTYVV